MDQEEEPENFQLTHNFSHENVDQSQPVDAAQEEQHRHVEERLQEMDLQDEGSQPVARTEDVESQQLAHVGQLLREVKSSGVAAGPINIHFVPRYIRQTQFQDSRRNMIFESGCGNINAPGGEIYGNVGQPGEPTIQRTPQNIAEQPGPSNTAEQDFQHREIILRLEKYHYEHYGEYEELELLRIYEQIRQINDEQLTTNAAELFPEELDLYPIKLTESQIDSLLFILTKVEKRIEELRLIKCFSKPEDVGRLFEAIQAMPGKIGELDISGNIIPKIPSKFFFNKIEDWLFMGNCFTDDDATDWKRHANQSEIDEIQRVLDQLDDSKLTIYLGLRDGDSVELCSRKNSDVSV
ncbi:uncharacterized protein LOC143470294 isoform X2 [Clavelina lepadiformis]|uniref:uncharacterized protein LOC143470294 isoform X2 n=1 Tax=Clavelina lepadiformis TaxID=159417 RepID=UPI004040FF1B